MDMRDLKERLSQLSVELGRFRPVTDLRLLTAPIDAVAEIERLESSAEPRSQEAEETTDGPYTLIYSSELQDGYQYVVKGPGGRVLCYMPSESLGKAELSRLNKAYLLGVADGSSGKPRTPPHENGGG